MWQACLDDAESDAWVILEDDIEPQTSLQDLFNEIDFNHIDILKLSGKRKVPYKAIKTLENGYQLCKLAYGSNDLAGMVITKKAAARLLQYSQTLDNAIDEVVDRSFEHGMPIYGVLPWPVDAPVILDTKNPLVSEIGLRPKKNIAGITCKHRILMKLIRFQDSLKKRKATIQLKLSR
jgi:glycosyl transferase family 25